MFTARAAGEASHARLLRAEPVPGKAMLASFATPSWRLLGACVAPDPVTGEPIIQFHCLDIPELMALQHALELAHGSAQAASLAEANFLATMNHEIRTPLNGLLGTLHVVRPG